MTTGDGLLGGLGRACYRHRKTTLVTWVAGVAVLITLWTRFGAATPATHVTSVVFRCR